MDKQMTRTDYMIAVLTIFMIVCIVGSFFIGFNLGTERAEGRYEKLLAANTPDPEPQQAYSQQSIVSFYHNMYLPFREFQDAWFNTLDNAGVTKGNQIDAVKKLVELAEDTHEAMKNKTMTDESPLLTEALTRLTDSLNGFAVGLNSVTKSQSDTSTEAFVQALQNDPYLIEAKKAALEGQRDFYVAMVKWYQAIDPRIQPSDPAAVWTVSEWNSLPLLVKNQYVAERMLAENTFRPYLPQDVTLRIDDLIASGQSATLNMNDVPSVFRLLNNTEAIRNGDYIAKRSNRYKDDILPDLPFLTIS